MYIKRVSCAAPDTMGDFFADLRSGIEMPQVVMNQGPFPGSGGLPRPLHDTADARINYNSSLLGNLTPYAYGEPGYLSSQTAYLNIPHKIQKIVPVVFLPEARVGTTEFIDLPHPVDDGDLAFTLRLDRNSLFCTGLKNGDLRRAGLGTAVDPLINLATVNYILSGVQLGITDSGGSSGDLWRELLFNLDRHRFGKGSGMGGRNYTLNPPGLDDIVHIIRHCIRPFGITRGSEKQGGQNEATQSPATWPVSFVVSVTIDGKESNVMNLWHHMNLSAGDDLVLCLRLMPLRPYTLNHYYKGVRRQSWAFQGEGSSEEKYVWQLVPALGHLDGPSTEEEKLMNTRLASINKNFRVLRKPPRNSTAPVPLRTVDGGTPWQDLGYWHIGRAQIMTGKYGVEEYWHNDMANSLRTNHLDITLQPMFLVPPSRKTRVSVVHVVDDRIEASPGRGEDGDEDLLWKPSLGLENIFGGDGELDGPSEVIVKEDERGSGVLGSWACDLLGFPRVLSSSLGGGVPVDIPSIADILEEGNCNDKRVSPAPSSADMSIGQLDFTDDPPMFFGDIGVRDAPAIPPVASEVVLEVAHGAGTSNEGSELVSGSSSGTSQHMKPSGSAPSTQPPAKRGRGGGKAVVGGSLLKADGSSVPSAVGML